MAGRAAVFQLLPFSVTESPKVSWFRGGFPEVVARPALADTWFRSYVQTYLERDVRQVTTVHDLATFRRFLALAATRCGQVLNRTDLAAPLGLAVPTISRWLSILEITGQLLLVPPYFENFGKRLTKSPKLYFADAGLACHLLGISSEAELLRSPFAGPIFETFVASEIVKAQVHSGRARALYFFRDAQGLEVDFLVPRGGGRVALVEAKASRTAVPADAEPIARLSGAMPEGAVDAFVVHRRLPRDAAPSLRSGVRAVGVGELLDEIA
jgi:predicted AAA+ superfamily ATPase